MELGMPASASGSPFRSHILPLAHQHQGVLHALLGLSACHMGLSRAEETIPEATTLGLQHRADALVCLGLLLLKEASQGLTAAEEEFVLAMVVLLVFHDICESGVSSHGAHLTGMAFLCSRIASPSAYPRRTTASMFFLVTLAWLDMLRGFSGAEKLAYSNVVRKCVRDHGSLHLQTFIGCHPSIFYQIGLTLEAAKAHRQGSLSTAQFQATLDDTETFLRGWDSDQAVYPTPEPEWKLLADAYCHACLLRVMRWPDTFALPCTDERIQASVVAILDIAATIPRTSRFYKRLLFPLFMAGADAASLHQMHYVRLCIDEIKESTGIPHHALTQLLTDVWEERRTNPRGLRNVPWMEFYTAF
ncbi:fungal specific transcription factor [Hirsutella rhossiliensis]|uniref:Fungal specific transcription factor domain-containing protein n=1 Tax=Hirsutella rhossiliensis TaxID=111463 RepID=A0A9P8N6G6_9HYPO|nr:fungal specific transcription factor domain-containing protein [Hirsutella rhossiliensis]KAH0968518.1 fungal specific transcription factor domain-containing protein [Hirsutella rhossiliensis]